MSVEILMKDLTKADKYLHSLDETPSQEDLARILELAKRHGNWYIRDRAVNILGRMKYGSDTLAQIAKNDENQWVRQSAEKWLTNYRGEMVKYECERSKNPFGKHFGRLELPVEAVIAVIDRDESQDKEVYSIGLSAMQAQNLDLRPVVQTDDIIYEGLSVEADGKTVPVRAYHAGGARLINGCGIRASSKLTADLKLDLGNTVKLHMNH